MLTLPFSLCSIAAILYPNIVHTNDDGWGVANIRAQHTILDECGFNAVLSSPAENESGTGSTSAAATVLNQTCEFDTCPIGSPPEGFNASDPKLNYVNAYPVDAARYGIQTLAPKFFNGQRPDIVMSGTNIGLNLGTVALISGTVGAACEAAKEGISAIAYSGATGEQVSYTTLSSSPNASSSLAANIYGELSAHFASALMLGGIGSDFTPKGTIVTINYPAIDNCPSATDFRWVMSRNLAAPAGTRDVETCGNSTLPAESDVVGTPGCYSSVTVLNATTKADVDAATQAAVLERLWLLDLSCLPQ